MAKKVKMNRKIKRDWIRALLSGDYRQVRGRLANMKNGRCCLGVLADVCHVPFVREGRSMQYCFSTEEAGAVIDSESLPVEFQKKIGLRPDAQGHLIEMNDNEKVSFEGIAAWIRKNL